METAAAPKAAFADVPPPSDGGGGGSSSANNAAAAAPPPKPLFGDAFTSIENDYILGRRLGSGNFAKVVYGEVKRAQPQWKLKAGDGVAVKVVKKPSSRRAVERVQMLKAEVEILRSIHHPNIVRLYDIYESPSRLYLVMELLTGGELFDRIVGLGKYSEEDARYFTFKLLNAVLYLHDRNICHRDLKPENILLASPEAEAELKITDFGLSKISALPHEFLMSTRCGTPGYVAPEVLEQSVTHGQLRKYGTSCDMWSVGVIVYILLSAAPPFYGKTDAEMNKRIKQGIYKFPDKYWAHISSAAKDFIGRLLTVDPTRRMSASEALQHDWIVSIGMHTNDLFASASMRGVPVMQARFGEFNQERRGEIKAHQGIKDLLALPEDEEELHHFRCSHDHKTGHLVLTPGHIGFLAYDQSTMFSLPICAIEHMRPARLHTWTAASDNSLVLRMANEQTIQFDGFWERDECMQLLLACGRFLSHHIAVDEEVEDQGSDMESNPASPSGSSGAARAGAAGSAGGAAAGAAAAEGAATKAASEDASAMSEEYETADEAVAESAEAAGTSTASTAAEAPLAGNGHPSSASTAVDVVPVS